ncbi:MAG TPA: hypothetical protein VFS31_07155 [Chitinophagaceae bacterium]|nr:hypothetical protein [Chitinophagaceae bacterium]
MDDSNVIITALGAMITLVGAFSAFALKLTKSFMEFLKEERAQRDLIMTRAIISIERLANEVRQMRADLFDEEEKDHG